MGNVIVTVTCDWDALDYRYATSAKEYVPPDRFNNGIKAILKFHELFKGAIPITHFICPAYFTRNSKSEATYADGMKTLADKGDEIALHIHCWKSLIEQCDVAFLDPKDTEVPDWGRTHGSPLGLQVDTDYGHGVPLGAYSYGDIVKIMNRSRALLCRKVGMKESACLSYRSGGWMSSDSVFRAVENVGFKYEASAVNYLFFGHRAKNTLDTWLETLWGGGSSEDFLSNRRFRIPYHSLPSGQAEISALQPRTTGLVVEIPDTGVLADYVEVEWMKKHIKSAVTLAADSPTDVYVSFGFHLESGGDSRFGDKGFADRSFGGKQFGATGYIGRLVEVFHWAQDKYKDIQYQRIDQVGEKFQKFID